MDLEKYAVSEKLEDKIVSYPFTSIGAKGEILKIVQFSPIEGDFYILRTVIFCAIYYSENPHRGLIIIKNVALEHPLLPPPVVSSAAPS